MIKSKMTLSRHGEFKLEATGDNHCGLIEGFQIVWYSIYCECKSKLDDRDFLFDQVLVDNFLQNIKTCTVSCEKLAIDCCNKLVELIKRDNPTIEIVKMTISISPEPHHASISLERTY